MKMRDEKDFLQEVLEELDGLPDEFSQRLIELVESTSTQRRDGIRELIIEVSRA